LGASLRGVGDRQIERIALIRLVLADDWINDLPFGKASWAAAILPEDSKTSRMKAFLRGRIFFIITS
jgi:hypothetical protein